LKEQSDVVLKESSAFAAEQLENVGGTKFSQSITQRKLDRKMAKRLTEFTTSSRRYIGQTRLFAWADYKRGDIPDSGEIDYICRRVNKAYPDAELIRLNRQFIPEKNGGEPKLVRWEFEWIVYDHNKESEMTNDKNN
jgi:hypothetical protein